MVGLVLSLAGCSLTIQGPPARSATAPTSAREVSCDGEARGRLFLDGFGAIAFGGYAGLFLHAQAIGKPVCLGPDCRGDAPGWAPGLTLAAISAGFIALVVRGVGKTRACRRWLATDDARERRRAWREHVEREQQRRAERAAAAARRQREAERERCDRMLAAWRAEVDPRRKSVIYRDMSTSCQQQVTTPRAPR